jgi:hypothetical protein
MFKRGEILREIRESVSKNRIYRKPCLKKPGSGSKSKD